MSVLFSTLYMSFILSYYVVVFFISHSAKINIDQNVPLLTDIENCANCVPFSCVLALIYMDFFFFFPAVLVC